MPEQTLLPLGLHHTPLGSQPTPYCMQGTAATACAGVYGALEIQDRPLSDITKQRFVMVGAGSAGMGVTTMLSLGMRKYVRPCSPPAGLL